MGNRYIFENCIAKESGKVVAETTKLNQTSLFSTAPHTRNIVCKKEAEPEGRAWQANTRKLERALRRCTPRSYGNLMAELVKERTVVTCATRPRRFNHRTIWPCKLGAEQEQWTTESSQAPVRGGLPRPKWSSCEGQ